MSNASEIIFWMVWSPQGRAPTYQHPSYEGAVSEAKRLALLHHDMEFIVLQAVKKFNVATPLQETTYHDLPF